jgi:hypothetical protein
MATIGLKASKKGVSIAMNQAKTQNLEITAI